MDNKLEDGSVARVEIINENIVVLIDDNDMGKIKVSGFLNKADAEKFIMFGDWQDPDDNDFIKIVRPSYSLSWTFGA